MLASWTWIGVHGPYRAVVATWALAVALKVFGRPTDAVIALRACESAAGKERVIGRHGQRHVGAWLAVPCQLGCDLWEGARAAVSVALAMQRMLFVYVAMRWDVICVDAM